MDPETVYVDDDVVTEPDEVKVSALATNPISSQRMSDSPYPEL
jgi:hypothetical protein